MTKSDIFIDELRERLSIVDIIGKKVDWDYKKTNVRSGTYWACCPFHNEKTASFKVDENKGLFYCFGCHEKGDTISFVMKNYVMNCQPTRSYPMNCQRWQLSLCYEAAQAA